MTYLETLRKKISEIPEGMVVAEHTNKGHFYRYQPTGALLASATTKLGVLNTSGHLKKWAATCAVGVLKDYVMTPGAIIPFPDDVEKSAIMSHEDIFKDAGGIGTQGHGVVEEYMKEWITSGVKPEDITKFIPVGSDFRLNAIARSAERFFNELHVEPVASELLVANPEHGYAGTLDSLLIVKMPVAPINWDGFNGKHKHEYIEQEEMFDQHLYSCRTCPQIAVRLFVLGDWKTSNSIDKPEYAMQVSGYDKGLTFMTGLETDQLWIIRLDKDQAKYQILRIVSPESAFDAFLLAGKMYDLMHSNSLALEPVVERAVVTLADLHKRNGTEIGDDALPVRRAKDARQGSDGGNGLVEV